MAKTVFGMPGAGKEQKGGDAVAPQGTPGAKTGQALPQKTGKDTPEGDPEGAQGEDKPLKAQSDAPMVKPAPRAKVKPAPQGAVVQGASPDGNKTMFGMPAMKLPQQPAAGAAQPGSPGQQKGGAPPRQTPGDAADQTAQGLQAAAQQPQPAAQVGGDTADAFKATELGMPPALVSDEPPLPEEAQPRTGAPIEQEPSSQFDQELYGNEPSSGVRSVRQGATAGGSKAWIWIVLGSILVVLAAIGIALYFLIVLPAQQVSEQALQNLQSLQQGAGIPPSVPVPPPQPAQPVQPAPQPGQAPPPPTPAPQ